MYLVDTEAKTIKECNILEKKAGYTIIQVGNEILGLPAEDGTHYLCEKYEAACSLLCPAFTIVPQ